MTTLVFFLEEPSAREMLESFLPRILPQDYETQFVIFEGKSDLDKRLASRLSGWQTPDCKFVVLRDQDSADCHEVKAALRQKCLQGRHPETLVRIACHELESWYLGDLQAVELGLEIHGLARNQGKKKYRDPDETTNPAQALINLTKGSYHKVSGSRAIGSYLDPQHNRSRSFHVFAQGLQRLWSEG